MSEQQLNSLERFRKRSPRLLLEQYDSCEVPAGCGGVVLRWRDPHAARPVVVSAAGGTGGPAVVGLWSDAALRLWFPATGEVVAEGVGERGTIVQRSALLGNSPLTQRLRFLFEMPIANLFDFLL